MASAHTQTETPRILVMGCGGIGGVMAAGLLASGRDVTIVTHNPAIAAAINERGLVVRDGQGEHGVRGRAWVTLPPAAGPFDFAFLATQPTQVEAAARSVAGRLAAGGALVCFQNGLCEQRVAAIAGTEQTLGAIVAWGGSMVAPGAYERTSAGGFVVGRLDGRTDDRRLATLQQVLGPIGPVAVTQNLHGARWSKLAINCAISSLGTIGGQRLGALLRYRFVRRLALEVMTEAVAVARARNVRLEKVAGTVNLDWVALTAGERRAVATPTLLAKHALLLLVGAKFRRLRSSMLTAIERGREPGVEFLNGEVAAHGRDAGISTPVNARVVEMVHAVARRAVQPGVPLLRRLYTTVRAEQHPPAATTSP